MVPPLNLTDEFYQHKITKLLKPLLKDLLELLPATFLTDVVCVRYDLIFQFILLFSLFLLLYMSFIALFNIIYKYYYTISTYFYLYYSSFSKKISILAK